MPLFRGKKKLPEVNYFEGGAGWTNYAVTIDMSGQLPVIEHFLFFLTRSIAAKDYAGNTLLKAVPWAFDFNMVSGTTVIPSATSGVTSSTGLVTGVTFTIITACSFTLTFKGCFVNKVLTVTITA